MLDIVKKNGMSLCYASDLLKNDREIVLKAIQQNEMAFKFASAAMKDDAEVVMNAVAQTSTTLRFASPAMQNGGLEAYVTNLKHNSTPRQTLIATILFGAKEAPNIGSHTPGLCDNSSSILSLLRPGIRLPSSLSIQIKRLIAEYMGVVGEDRWRVVYEAARNLGVS